MKPIFEYHTGGKKYEGFVDGRLEITKSSLAGDVIVNRAQPLLDLFVGIAAKHNEAGALEILNEFYPEYPSSQTMDVMSKVRDTPVPEWREQVAKYLGTSSCDCDALLAFIALCDHIEDLEKKIK